MMISSKERMFLIVFALCQFAIAALMLVLSQTLTTETRNVLSIAQLLLGFSMLGFAISKTKPGKPKEENHE